MRILWSSNAVWAHSGYGIQAKYLLPRFQQMGHKVAQFAWYGLQGAAIHVGDMPIYPIGNDRWGSDIIGAHVAHFRADVVVSLMDIWVLPPDYRERCGVPWVCWFPVDHEPAPSLVVERAKTADYPVVYARFGERMMANEGLACHYIPHGVDCGVYAPGSKAESRRKIGLPEDGFLCAMVAANKGTPSRKAIAEQIMAFAAFAKERPDLNPHLYLHMDVSTAQNGIDVRALVRSLGISERVRNVDQYLNTVGLPEEYLAHVYNAADVLLAAAMSEGFGIPIIEAQACGCPVITTNATSMPELTFNGIATEPAQPYWTPMGAWIAMPSVANITEALRQVSEWGEAERADRAQFGLEQVRQNYSWDVCVERYWRPFLERVEHDIEG